MALIYMAVKKKCDKYILVLFSMILLSIINIAVCPGNSSRLETEMIKFQPTFIMMNILNKLDVGLFSSLCWLFFDNNCFVLVVLVEFSVLIFIMYKKNIYRILSILPILITLLFRRFISSNISINAFYLTAEEIGTSKYGLFNAGSINDLSTYIIYFIFGLLLFLILMEIILLCNKTNDLIEILTILSLD